MKQYIAVIDCGTNTFTLSLYDISCTNNFKCIDKERHFVELAEEGIQQIGERAILRGLAAFQGFKTYLEAYPNSQTYAIGTAALRTAANGSDFIAAIHKSSGILIHLIDGDKEADLIYKGVRMAAPLTSMPSLVMDIGGGSVEFVIANKSEVFWAKSYPIGNSVLFGKFHQSNPILLKEIKQLENHLEESLQDLLEQLKKTKIEYLIGASGTFDVFDSLIGSQQDQQPYKTMSIADFNRIKQQLTKSTYQERLEILPHSSTRAKLVVMSVSLINFIIKRSSVKKLISSENALREGLVFDALNS